MPQMSLTPRGHMLSSEAGRGVFDRHMFLTMWGPAVHAVSVVLEYVDSPAVADMALRVGGGHSLLAAGLAVCFICWQAHTLFCLHLCAQLLFTHLCQDLNVAVVAHDLDGAVVLLP